MRILLLPKYGRQGASSRLRTWQYVPYFEERGYDLTISPLFTDEMLSQRYAKGRHSHKSQLKAASRRFHSAVSMRGYDLIWIEKELAPYIPGMIERITLARCRYILDYDDAVFHNYDLHRSRTIQWLFARKIPGLIRNASAIVAGNRYLAEFAKASAAKRTEIVPTVIELERYSPRTHFDGIAERIVWIGSPTTSKYLNAVATPLKDAFAQFQTRTRIIGSDRSTLSDESTDYLPWSEQSEASQLRASDIGIMPLSDSPWERGKCGYKLIQYMAAGLPVIASPVGANTEIVEHGVNGFLAETQDDWQKYLNLLITDPDLRAKLGTAGRKSVETHYNTAGQAARLVSIFESL